MRWFTTLGALAGFRKPCADAVGVVSMVTSLSVVWRTIVVIVVGCHYDVIEHYVLCIMMNVLLLMHYDESDRHDDELWCILYWSIFIMELSRVRYEKG